MEFLIGFASTVAAAAACALFANVAPDMANAIVRRAATRLHPDIRQTCEEEWLADVDRRLSPISKLRAAFSFYLGAGSLPLDAQGKDAPDMSQQDGTVMRAANGSVQIVLRRVNEEGQRVVITYSFPNVKHDDVEDVDALLDMLGENEHDEAADVLSTHIELRKRDAQHE